jgi:hypothetical protein
MGRKQSNTVEYFPHFAKWGKTLPILKAKWGNDGYAVWFQTLELLCAEDGHYYDCRQVDNWQFLLARVGVSEEVARDVFDLLAKLGNIDKTLWGHGIIWCQNLVDNLAPVYQNRRRNAPAKPNFIEVCDGEPLPTVKSEHKDEGGGDTPAEKQNDSSGESITTCRNTTAPPISTKKKRQSRVKQSKVKIPPKGGLRQAQGGNNKKDITIKEIFQEMQEYLGFPEKVSQDPIPSYGREGQSIKRMLTRGFTREAIVECWKGKVSQRGGEFVSMTWVNEDIGKPEKQKRGVKQLSTEAEIAASIEEVKS